MINISNNWFSPRERVFMTSLACLFSFGGISAGFILPPLSIDADEKNMDISKQ